MESQEHLPKKIVQLIDADGLLYTAALKAQKMIDWGDDNFTVQLDMALAKINLDSQLAAIEKVSTEDGTYIQQRLCLSDPTKKYFRHDIYPEYKANRKGGTSPLGIKKLREWCKANYETVEFEGLEADDVLGILGTAASQGQPVHMAGQETSYLIVSVDKDLDQIPGMHLNPSKLLEGTYEVTEAEGNRMLYFQALCGDSVDGYPGCPGVGPVGANKILDQDKPEDMPENALNAFLKKGLTLQYFETQVNVARILQTKDWVRRAKKPIYWEYKVDA